MGGFVPFSCLYFLQQFSSTVVKFFSNNKRPSMFQWCRRGSRLRPLLRALCVSATETIQLPAPPPRPPQWIPDNSLCSLPLMPSGPSQRCPDPAVSPQSCWSDLQIQPSFLMVSFLSTQNKPQRGHAPQVDTIQSLIDWQINRSVPLGQCHSEKKNNILYTCCQ